MKKIVLFSLLACFAFVLQAQEDEKLEKPKDIKVAEFDDFKNSAFNIYEKSEHYKQMSDGEEGLNAEDVIGAKKLKNDLVTLNEKAEDLLKKAKSLTPKTKSPAAVKNTNSSIKALDKAKENMDYVFSNMNVEDEDFEEDGE
ncbi:MAG: hypothetical protein JEZ09_18760 [Salinivirgaceae bacterium]|nr:hypothetical protein [Salinivirgaceae bacterium]